MGIGGFIFGLIGLLVSIGGLLWPLSNTITIVGLVLAGIGIIMSCAGLAGRSKISGAFGLIMSVIALILGILMMLACGIPRGIIGSVF